MSPAKPYKTVHKCPNCKQLHPHWDCSIAPALVVRQGEIFSLTSPDAANGLLTRQSSSQDMARIDYNQLDPLCGPVFVEGAQVGDVLRIEVLDLELGDWGWTGLIPGFGLLHDEFPQAYLQTFDLTGDSVEILGERFALNPMMGVLGTAPGRKGAFPSIAPTLAGGNIDVRYLQAGATLYLPVFNEGALLSGGDGHGLQGEGEVSGAAIEAPMTSTLRVEVLRGAALSAPVLDMTTRNYPETEYRNFLGIGPDLMAAARDATRYAIDALAAAHNIAPHVAYSVFGMVAELRIHEIVDQPNWVVGCMLPRRLFASA